MQETGLYVWNNEIKSPRIDEYKKIRVITVGTWRQRKNWKLMVNCMTEAFKSLENLEVRFNNLNPTYFIKVIQNDNEIIKELFEN